MQQTPDICYFLKFGAPRENEASPFPSRGSESGEWTNAKCWGSGQGDSDLFVCLFIFVLLRTKLGA